MAAITEYWKLKDYPNAKTIPSQFSNTILINDYTGITDSDGQYYMSDDQYVDITFTSNCEWTSDDKTRFDFYFEYTDGTSSDLDNNNFLKVFRKTLGKIFKFKTGETWRFFGNSDGSSSTQGLADPVNITNSVIIKDGRVVEHSFKRNGKDVIRFEHNSKKVDLPLAFELEDGTNGVDNARVVMKNIYVDNREINIGKNGGGDYVHNNMYYHWTSRGLTRSDYSTGQWNAPVIVRDINDYSKIVIKCKIYSIADQDSTTTLQATDTTLQIDKMFKATQRVDVSYGTVTPIKDWVRVDNMVITINDPSGAFHVNYSNGTSSSDKTGSSNFINLNVGTIVSQELNQLIVGHGGDGQGSIAHDRSTAPDSSNWYKGNVAVDDLCFTVWPWYKEIKDTYYTNNTSFIHTKSVELTFK